MTPDRDLEAEFFGIIAASYTHEELEVLIQISERINAGWGHRPSVNQPPQGFFRGFAA